MTTTTTTLDTITATSLHTAVRLTEPAIAPRLNGTINTPNRTRKPCAAASIAAAHGYTIDNGNAADIALAAGHTRRMINKIVQRPRPRMDDVFEAMAGFQPHLMAHVILEIAAIVECASDHDPGWWDEDHMTGTHVELLVDWAMSPEEAEDIVILLSVLNRYTIDSLFLAPGAPIELNPNSPIELPGLGDIARFLVVAGTVIRHAGRRRTWYTACRRCRGCNPV